MVEDERKGRSRIMEEEQEEEEEDVVKDEGWRYGGKWARRN